MNVYVLPDPHLDHTELALYTNRPPEHTRILCAAVRATVRPGDLLVLLGDVHIGPHDALPGALRRLVPPGVHAMVTLGNHDTAPAAAFLAAGVVPVTGVTVGGLYLSHTGTTELPGDARGQVHGHYHDNPPNPGLPHALLVSIERDGYEPLELGALRARMEAGDMLRALPAPAEDRWQLLLDEHAHITVIEPDGQRTNIITGRPRPAHLPELPPGAALRVRRRALHLLTGERPAGREVVLEGEDAQRAYAQLTR